MASLFETKTEHGTEICKTHGEFECTRTYVGLMKRWVCSACPSCVQERKDAEAAQKELERKELQRRQYERFLDLAAIPTRFTGLGFDDFVANADKQISALAAVRSFAENFEQHFQRGDGLVLSGKPGTGKSHLACAVIQHIYPNAQGQYVTISDMIRSIRDTWRKDSEKSESDVLNLLTSLDLLVIDEVGVQYGTDAEKHLLFEVMDKRYREMVPTVLITNQNSKGLKDFVGERVFDRLKQTSKWVPFEWDSHRSKARS